MRQRAIQVVSSRRSKWREIIKDVSEYYEPTVINADDDIVDYDDESKQQINLRSQNFSLPRLLIFRRAPSRCEVKADLHKTQMSSRTH